MIVEQRATNSKDRHRAYVLLVELLAYQFASPVRWIDTQDVLFRQKNTKRVVEVGTSNVLGTIAKRTLVSEYEVADAVNTIQRKVFSWGEDTKEICYEAVKEEKYDEETPKPRVQQTSEHVVTQSVAPSRPRQTKAVNIPDEPLTPDQILRVIIACKLKKPLADIASTASIKILAGGRSTLQNELIGDIENEFGTLPEAPEDLHLVDLAQAININYKGGLGKQTSSLVSRMMSTKMPGGFIVLKINKHLEDQWGLGPERQKAVLLMALTNQPNTRFASVEEAKIFFDTAAHDYASQSGISLDADRSIRDDALGANAVIDSAALDRFINEQNRLSSRQLDILASHLKVDLRAHEKALIDSQAEQEANQAQIDLWNIEHGEIYRNGIAPMFEPLKVRIYDSSWNWVRDEIFAFVNDLPHLLDSSASKEVEIVKWRILNKCNPQTLLFLKSIHARSKAGGRNFSESIETHLLDLITDCERHHVSKPLFRAFFQTSAPRTVISGNGVVEYSEVTRGHDPTAECYCREMMRMADLFTKATVLGLTDKVQKFEESSDLHKLLYTDERTAMSRNDNRLLTPPEDPSVDDTESIDDFAKLRELKNSPPLSLKQWRKDKWVYSSMYTTLYMHCLSDAACVGVSFSDRVVLLTGSGMGSIGGKVLEGLLDGGATVIATTSSFSQANTMYYRNIYNIHGARGSRLVILPFNQSSKQDIESLIRYIYDADNGLGLDLDHVIPFAAISEGDTQISNIDSKSELAHRLMMTNLIRLLGKIKEYKQRHNYFSRPTQAILPLSLNHGIFGGDGLYSESKVALQTLLHKWTSEEWGSLVTICGANIGWTRGTGLMSTNNIVAQDIEALGARTFSTPEMALNLLGLMTSPVKLLCEEEPIIADLTGSLNSIDNLKSVTTKIRAEIQEKSEIRILLAAEHARMAFFPDNVPRLASSSPNIQARANIDFGFASLVDYCPEIASLSKEQTKAIDLEKVVVVTGFAEVGPLGNSRTRWDVEVNGKLSLEGCIEMAWIMGFIKHYNGLVTGTTDRYSGWIDVKTREPLTDAQIKSRFERRIEEHSGIRHIEPSLLKGRDNRLLQEIVIKEDLAPFEASKEEALSFQKLYGAKAEIMPGTDTNVFQVLIKAGAVVSVPREVSNDHLVGAQLPDGWDPRRYGISEEIINQVDRATLYTLVCTAEALLNSGIVDAYEFYKYVHVSEIANCIGSGLGGADALRSIYKDRTLDKPVQNDILQETFINTISAWVNMLLISSSGPIKTPVGACATALESVSIGCETILSGQAKICLVGGVDSFNEEIATEFGNMKATVNPRAEVQRGRSPKEMSRPNTSTRAGFVESEGCGVQILTTAKLALVMGLPIHGIIAMASTATDKIGRSVPAPGKGLLVNAREDATSSMAPLRGALAKWHLKTDDLAVACMHGTSTNANDKNESDIICKQLHHLGRQKGNLILSVTQKHLTGHPKGAAGAWMLNGAMQILNSGVVPGNQNLDNVDENFQKFDLIHYPAKCVKTEGVKAISITSFGFGQKNAQTIAVHAKHLFAALDEATYSEYKFRAVQRQRQTYREWHHRIISNSIVQAKQNAPYSAHSETNILLSPGARASNKDADGEYRISHELTQSSPSSLSTPAAQIQSAQPNQTELKSESELGKIGDFALPQNSAQVLTLSLLTQSTSILQGDNPCISFAGRWAAKEAVFKSLGVPGKGAGSSMRDIEISVDQNGGPVVNFHGDAKAQVDRGGVKQVEVSISHTESQAMAVAIAIF